MHFCTFHSELAIKMAITLKYVPYLQWNLFFYRIITLAFLERKGFFATIVGNSKTQFNLSCKRSCLENVHEIYNKVALLLFLCSSLFLSHFSTSIPGWQQTAVISSDEKKAPKVTPAAGLAGSNYVTC